MPGQPDLTLVRYFSTDRYVLRASDGQELAVLSKGLPGEASVDGRTVLLTTGRRNWRISIEAADGQDEIGWIASSWVPGRHRIRVGDSEFRVTREFPWRGWRLSRDGVRVTTLTLVGSFYENPVIVGGTEERVGRLSLAAPIDVDIPLAFVLLLKMLLLESVVPAVASAA